MTTCRHCGRPIVHDPIDGWVDPEATGDDSVWRETCDEHDTFIAGHEPEEGPWNEDAPIAGLIVGHDGIEYRNSRLVATFHVNGGPDAHIWLNESGSGGLRQAFLLTQAGVGQGRATVHSTFRKAIGLALNNNGWGTGR